MTLTKNYGKYSITISKHSLHRIVKRNIPPDKRTIVA